MQCPPSSSKVLILIRRVAFFPSSRTHWVMAELATSATSDLDSANVGSSLIRHRPVLRDFESLKREKEQLKIISAQEFIEAVLDEPFPSDFYHSLKSGVRLCRVINQLLPNTIKQISTKSLPFIQMENISNFLVAARTLGVPDHDLFRTVDLYEGKNLNQVAITVLTLARILTGITVADQKQGLSEAQRQRLRLMGRNRQSCALPDDYDVLRGEELAQRTRELKREHQAEVTRALTKRRGHTASRPERVPIIGPGAILWQLQNSAVETPQEHPSRPIKHTTQNDILSPRIADKRSREREPTILKFRLDANNENSLVQYVEFFEVY